MTHLRFVHSYRNILHYGKLAGLPLPSLENESQRAKVLYVIFDLVVAIFLSWKLTCVGRFVLGGEFMEKVIAETVLILAGTGLALSGVYAFKMGHFKKLLASTDRMSYDILSSGIGQETLYEDLYRDDSRLLVGLNRIMCPSMLCSPICYCLSVPLVAYFQGTYRQRFPVPAYCPFEKKSPGLYELFVILQMLTSTFPALQRVGNEFICISLLRIQSAYYKYLTAAIRHIGMEMKGGITEQTNDKIRRWVQLHQKTLRNVADFQDMLSPIVVVYYLSMIGLIASGLFYELNVEVPDVGQTVGLSLFLVICMFQFYFLVHVADELSTQAEKMANEVYCIPWYEMDEKSKGCIRLIINVANRPISMMAYKATAFSMNREAFIGLMVNIVRAYMGFSQIKSLE